MPAIEMIEIKKLKLLDKNPRKIDKNQFQKLCDSLEKDPDYFETRPCLVNVDDQDNYSVYAGNQRVRAAKKLGWKLVPCIIQHGLKEEIIRSRTIKDNAHYGDWDYDLLGNEWESDLLLEAGMTEKDLHLCFNEEIEKTAAAKEEDPISKCPHCGMDI